MSNQLLWSLVKNNNSFLVKNNGVTLSRDPANPTGRNTLSSCGLVRKGAVAVSALLPNAAQKRKSTQYKLTFNKRARYPQKSRQATKTQTAAPADFTLQHATESLTVKKGVHSAARVIFNFN